MLDLTPIPIAPGFFTLDTDRGAKGRWKDGNRVRFHNGIPEKIGGWQKSSANVFVGICRKLFDWKSLSLLVYIGVGTHKKLYVWNGGSYYDVTPIRRTAAPLGNDPFTTTDLLATVSVADVGHGAVAGDYVTFSGAAAVNGITISGEYAITSITDADNYVITHSSAASGTGAGGGAAVNAAYQISIGNEDSAYGFGWGSGAWGVSTWGTPRAASNFLQAARVWSMDKWGEDLVANPRDGAIYLWDTSAGTGTRAAIISAAPATAKAILVSPENQHLVALGAYNGSANDPLLIRWCSSEDYTEWTAGPENSAGSKRLTTGNEILCGLKVRKEILIFTDSNLWSMRFSGSPNWFDFDDLGSNGGMLGPNAACEVNGVAFWIGSNDFYIYDGGAIKTLPCEVHPSVFDDINRVQKFKVYCGYCSHFNEIWWFYCSADSDECDRYVAFSVEEKVWFFGELERTSYIGDSKLFSTPLAAGADGYLYEHESTTNDDGAAMGDYIVSGDIELGDGDKLMFVNGLVPDFRELDGEVTFTISAKKYPHSTEVTSEAALTVDDETEFVNPRIKGRQMSMRIESVGVDSHWAMGQSRVRMKALGKK